MVLMSLAIEVVELIRLDFMIPKPLEIFLKWEGLEVWMWRTMYNRYGGQLTEIYRRSRELQIKQSRKKLNKQRQPALYPLDRTGETLYC